MVTLCTDKHGRGEGGGAVIAIIFEAEKGKINYFCSITLTLGAGVVSVCDRGDDK